MLDFVINFFIFYILGVIFLGKKRFSFEKQIFAVALSVTANVSVILTPWIVSTWFTS